MRFGVFGIIALLFLIGGYGAYRYAIAHPPTFVIEIVKRLNPAPPLPSGEVAPLIAPEGFRATIYSRSVPGARVMLRDEGDAILVSLTAHGKVVALRASAHGVAAEPVTVAEGLRKPHGLAIRCEAECTLYIAEEDAVRAYRYDRTTKKSSARENGDDAARGRRAFYADAVVAHRRTPPRFRRFLL